MQSWVEIVFLTFILCVCLHVFVSIFQSVFWSWSWGHLVSYFCWRVLLHLWLLFQNPFLISLSKTNLFEECHYEIYSCWMPSWFRWWLHCFRNGPRAQCKSRFQPCRSLPLKFDFVRNSQAGNRPEPKLQRKLNKWKLRAPNNACNLLLHGC